ncbi:substrate-binding domain-containing protein [Afifella sp. IM 167]|uniref:substrate-binding domain-containing protein n=1 Tax=Afifella sp. IM 167 TaxID=2033586 RepID=UPI001CCE28F6|nr:substrate-binding domain-containing protein [Afifella sp. IM 167]MBZ8131707.1 ABC transporter substrate-binding protein [Afifella sp. IM 167]
MVWTANTLSPTHRPFLSTMLLLVGIVLFFGHSAAAQAREDKVLVGGTGTALGGVQIVAEAFRREHPGIALTVLPSLGSGGGINALIAGKIDIALSARPLKESEASEPIRAQEYARTPIVFAVGSENPVDDITLQDAIAIYSGARATWPDAEPIRLILRPETEADIALLKSMSPEMKDAVETALSRSELHVAANDQDNADVLERVYGSLGVTTLGQIKAERRKLKPLAFNGVHGTVETIRSGEYPYAKRLYIVTRKDISGAAADFVTFIGSPEGQDLLRSSGHLPADDLP